MAHFPSAGCSLALKAKRVLAEGPDHQVPPVPENGPSSFVIYWYTHNQSDLGPNLRNLMWQTEA